MNIPIVIESDARGERAYDIYSRLMKDKIIVLGTAVNEYTSSNLVAQLLFLDSLEDKEKPIQFFINSPGGIVTGGMAIYDTMKYITTPVHTVCIGMAASMGAVLLSGGQKGNRYMLPHARVMVHQPLGGVQGQASDIEIEAREIIRIKNELTQLLADNCQKTYSEMEVACDRNYWMNADQALEFGIVDKIIKSSK
jgi:ATP-dependent Clp protease protease subunit